MIHQFKFQNLNIVLDVCSGSIHAVDDIAYDIIASYESEGKDALVSRVYDKYKSDVTKDEVYECYDQITELKERGKLFCVWYNNPKSVIRRFFE